jgi:hypothetical protein
MVKLMASICPLPQQDLTPTNPLESAAGSGKTAI